MTTYIINIESASAAVYERAHELAKSFGTWARISNSLWAVASEEKAIEIRDRFKEIVQESDRVFVLRSGTEAAWFNSRCENAWLKKHL